jgi:hypothetical protein
MPGTVLTRDYKGRTIRVLVLTDGFEWEGDRYKSLTAVTQAVTDKHWNGLHFFGLRKNGGAACRRAAARRTVHLTGSNGADAAA